MGLTDGSIADWQLAASSVASEAGCQLKYARLHNKNGHAWCPRYADKGQWLLIDLGVEAQVGLLSYFLNFRLNDHSKPVIKYPQYVFFKKFP